MDPTTGELPSLDELREQEYAQQAEALGEYAPAFYTMPWAQYRAMR